MELSIIIVNWNTAKLLTQCLESLTQNLKLKTEYEIIVVDNGSTDDSIKEVKNLKLKIENSLKIENCKLKIIQNDSNLGFAKAVNLGIKQSKGESILLLNSDTRIEPGALKEALEQEKKRGPAIFGLRMVNVDGSIQGSCFYLPSLKRAIAEYWLKQKNYSEKYFPKTDAPVEVEAVSGGAMLISRDVINEIGTLDERYFFYFEDLDYCRRAKKFGIKIFYLPSARVIHEHGASGKNLAKPEDQWKRLIPSSKVYHGIINYYILTLIILLAQKWHLKK